MPTNTIYVVRHALFTRSDDYKHEEVLSRDGITQAQLAGRQLANLGLSRQSLVVTAPQPRSEYTGTVIANVLRATKPKICPALALDDSDMEAPANHAHLRLLLREMLPHDKPGELIVVAGIAVVSALTNVRRPDYGQIVPLID
jgi:hypothetical protein